MDTPTSATQGMVAFAEALKSPMGALAKLEFIDMRVYAFGDAGLTALAEACASGALPSLKTLVVNYDPLGTEHPPLKAACEARDILTDASRNILLTREMQMIMLIFFYSYALLHRNNEKESFQCFSTAWSAMVCII